MKYRPATIAILLTLCVTVSAYANVAFDGIWGYLMAGEEQFLDNSYPLSDIGYFGAGLNAFGALSTVPDRAKISSFPGRVHLVVAEVGNQALTHFALNPNYPLRDRLVDDIVRAAGGYDGVQIDFETVHPADAGHFSVFLALLRQRLPPEKELSVAIPARVRKIHDAYDYAVISRIVDRVIVMAYDEHWSGSAPGSIASIEWCRRVLDYALATIDREKLVMGMPFYGRAWADQKHSRAYKHSTLTELKKDKKVKSVQRVKDIPFFKYTEPVSVTLYYEDVHSMLARGGIYRDAGVRFVSFWRLGQEDPAVWKALRVNR